MTWLSFWTDPEYQALGTGFRLLPSMDVPVQVIDGHRSFVLEQVGLTEQTVSPATEPLGPVKGSALEEHRNEKSR